MRQDNKVTLLALGNLIKQARVSKHLTQEQLGDLIGVKKSQVSRMENGGNLSFSTLAKVLRALEIPAWFDIFGIGKVALW